jgi:Flp pilus assembly protein TadG
VTVLNRLRSDDHGMVTAETAMVLPVLVLLSLVGVAAVGVAQARVRCADAAMVAARAVARGDPTAADSLARAAAGPAVRLATSALGDDTVVTARLSLRPLHWLGSVTIVETATVATEPVTPP